MTKRTTEVLDKKADLAGPGIGSYADLEKVLPTDYTPLLNPKETQGAITAVKRFIEDGLCRELNLMRVEVPLIVDAESGVNDYLDRDGSRGPVTFHIANCEYDILPMPAMKGAKVRTIGTKRARKIVFPPCLS